MKGKMTAAAIALVALTAGAVLAQAPTPSTTSPAMSAADKQAVSKACTDQANTKGLHGKARKKFRSECKKNGGKT